MRGHIHKRVHTTKKGSKSVLYYVVVDTTAANGERKQSWGRGYRTKKEAERVLVDRLQEVLTGSGVARSHMTTGEYISEVWLPFKATSSKPTTVEAYVNIHRLYIAPKLGGVRLQSLTPAVLATWQQWLLTEGGTGQRRGPRNGPDTPTRRPLSVNTARKVRAVLHGALTHAQLIGLLGSDPLHGLSIKGRSDPSPKAWTADELRCFLAEQRSGESWLGPVVHFASHTGARRGECLALAWNDVDVAARTVTIRRSVTVSAGMLHTDTPKNGRARTIDLDSTTVAILDSVRRQQAENRRTWGPAYTDSNLVFADELGRQRHPESVSSAFERAVAASPEVSRLTFHGLRHTHATLLLKAGVPVKVVAERLGHSDPAFTIRVYQAVLPGMQADAAAAFAAVLSSPGLERPS